MIGDRSRFLGLVTSLTEGAPSRRWRRKLDRQARHSGFVSSLEGAG